MEDKQVNLKETLLAVYRKQWQQEYDQQKAHIEALMVEKEYVEKSFIDAYPEFYQVLLENGLYMGFTLTFDDYSDQFVLEIGTSSENCFRMRYAKSGKIQPVDGMAFGDWPLDDLLLAVDAHLKIVPKEQYDLEFDRFKEQLNSAEQS